MRANEPLLIDVKIAGCDGIITLLWRLLTPVLFMHASVNCITHIFVEYGYNDVALPLTLVIRAHTMSFNNPHDSKLGVVASRIKCRACNEVRSVQPRPFRVS